MVAFKIQVNERDILDAIDARMDEIVDRIFADSQNIIVEKDIIDEGTLLKSGNINRDYLSKEIVYSVPYASVIEFGRTPGTFPPIEPIKQWLLRKLIVADEKEAQRVAFLIARDIKLRGQEPRPFLVPAIERYKKSVK